MVLVIDIHMRHRAHHLAFQLLYHWLSYNPSITINVSQIVLVIYIGSDWDITDFLYVAPIMLNLNITHINALLHMFTRCLNLQNESNVIYQLCNLKIHWTCTAMDNAFGIVWQVYHCDAYNWGYPAHSYIFKHVSDGSKWWCVFAWRSDPIALHLY